MAAARSAKRSHAAQRQSTRSKGARSVIPKGALTLRQNTRGRNKKKKMGLFDEKVVEQITAKTPMNALREELLGVHGGGGSLREAVRNAQATWHCEYEKA